MSEETGVTRIAISLPENLLKRFDEVLDVRGYSCRSEGVRDALRMYVTHNKWMSQAQGEHLGVLSLVYHHDQHGLLVTISDIEHEFRDVVSVSLHSYISSVNCLEILLVRGEGAKLRILYERLLAQKGVESVKLSIIALEE